MKRTSIRTRMRTPKRGQKRLHRLEQAQCASRWLTKDTTQKEWIERMSKEKGSRRCRTKTVLVAWGWWCCDRIRMVTSRKAISHRATPIRSVECASLMGHWFSRAYQTRRQGKKARVNVLIRPESSKGSREFCAQGMGSSSRGVVQSRPIADATNSSPNRAQAPVR